MLRGTLGELTARMTPNQSEGISGDEVRGGREVRRVSLSRVRKPKAQLSEENISVVPYPVDVM